MGLFDRLMGGEPAASYGTPDSAAVEDNSVMDGEGLVMPKVVDGKWTVEDYTAPSYSNNNWNIRIFLVVKGRQYYRPADTTRGVKAVQEVVDRIYGDYQTAAKEALQKEAIKRMIQR